LIQGFLLEASLSRGDLSEADWRILRGLLPIDAVNRGRGRPPEENRSIIDGILWRLRCGTPWRDVPPKYGNWNTIYRRFRRWSRGRGLGGGIGHFGRDHGGHRSL
jgi:transposase